MPDLLNSKCEGSKWNGRALAMENGSESGEERGRKEEENILQFLDSLDSYITLVHSLSSILRQGWLELASARHSMGLSRINSSLLDLKLHSAATTLQVDLPYDESTSGDPMVKQPHFTLSKWANQCGGKPEPEEVEFNEELWKSSYSSELRHRGPSNVSENDSDTNEAPLIVDDQIQKERAKSLSVFGTLVSPKLRAAQASFETALETLVKVANTRSSMLSAYAQVRQEMEGME